MCVWATQTQWQSFGPAAKLHKRQPCLHRLPSTQRGDEKKKKREKRKRPICSTKREEKKHLRLLCLVFYSLFLIVRRGKHRGGRMIMREHGKKLPKTEKESNGRCCGCKSSENNTVATGCQYDLFVKPILPLSRADTLLPRGSTHIQHSDT